MSEKMEKRLRIGVICLVVAVALLAILSFSSSSKYSQNDHLVEQGQLPVYVTPPDQTGDATLNNGNNSTVENNNTDATPPNPTEPTQTSIDKGKYEQYPYMGIIKGCSAPNPLYVKARVVIYSVLETSSGVIYDAADKEGYYYSIVDKSGSGVLFKNTDEVVVYCTTSGLAKLNNTQIPRLDAQLIEKVE